MCRQSPPLGAARTGPRLLPSSQSQMASILSCCCEGRLRYFPHRWRVPCQRPVLLQGGQQRPDVHAIGDYGAGVSTLEHLQYLQLRKNPPDIYLLGKSSHVLSNAYFLVGRFSEAEWYADKGLSMIRKSLPPNSPRIVRALYLAGTFTLRQRRRARWTHGLERGTGARPSWVDRSS